MTILTTSYEPTVVITGVAGEDLRFDFPNIGLIAIEIYELTEIGVRTLVPLDDYAISFAGDPGLRLFSTGGVVRFTRPYAADTAAISIERNTPIYQLSDFKARGEFHMNTVEFTLDRATMICQEIAFRKCVLDGGPVQTTPMDQLIDFHPYGPFEAATLDFVIDKLTAICLEIKASKEDCSNDLENT